MKKLYLLIVALLTLVLLASCSSSETGSGSKSGSTEMSIVESEPISNLADSLEIKDYSCVVSDTFAYYVAFITNNSEKTVDVEMNITAKDSDGRMVGSGTDKVFAIAQGQTSGIWTTFDDWKNIKTFDYNLDVTESAYQSIKEAISFDYNTTADRVVVSATNNGDKDANFVWVDVVFLNSGQMIGFGEISLMNDDCILKVGETRTGEAANYSEIEFDDAILAFNGRIYE